MVTAGFRSPPARNCASFRSAPGALRPPARSLKLRQLVTKSLPAFRYPGCANPSVLRSCWNERELGRESRFAVVRAVGWSVCAGGEARTSPRRPRDSGLGGLLFLRLHPGKRLRGLSPAARALRLPGTTLSSGCRNPGFPAGLRKDPALLQSVLKLCVKSWGSLMLLKK